MIGNIAVESGLDNVMVYLADKGYNVKGIDLGRQTPSLQSFDAIVVTGQSSSFLGMEDTKTRATVIDARGLSPEDVERELIRINGLK